MKYRAKPVIVEARVIKMVRGLQDSQAGGERHDFICLLDDGTEFRPNYGMTTRMTPVPGDYVVTQSDGYVYLNPKDVFERKYEPIDTAASVFAAPSSPRE